VIPVYFIYIIKKHGQNSMEYTGEIAVNMIEIGHTWYKKNRRKNEKP
jgi:hypothetical protein